MCDAGLRPDRLAGVLRLFTTLRTEVIGGQYLDLVHAEREHPRRGRAGRCAPAGRGADQRGRADRPLQVGQVHRGAPAAAGRRGRRSGAAERFLSGYSLPLGEAFQLRDDVLGVFGDPEATGKPAGEDIREGKQTLLLVLGRQMAGPAEKLALETVPGNPAATREDLAGVRAALAGCGALDAVERRIASLAGQARAALDEAADVPDDARAALLQLAGQATWRGR